MEKKHKLFVIISVVLIILGPILGLSLNKVTLFDQTVTIPDSSNTNITRAFNFPFSIEKDQKIVIEFSVHYLNVSATMKILGKGAYDSAYLAESNPNTITGENFIYSQFAFGQSPSSQTASTTSRSITYDGYWYCEFAGDTTGDYLISVPGEYIVIVYGTNDGGPAWTNVKFDIAIRIDGPGEILQLIFILIGVGALVAILLLLTFGYLKKTKRGLL